MVATAPKKSSAQKIRIRLKAFDHRILDQSAARNEGAMIRVLQSLMLRPLSPRFRCSANHCLLNSFSWSALLPNTKILHSLI